MNQTYRGKRDTCAERRWFVLERPRRDTNGGSETEVTVTSELQANAERDKEIEKRQRREEKAASFGGAGRGSVNHDVYYRRVDNLIPKMLQPANDRIRVTNDSGTRCPSVAKHSPLPERRHLVGVDIGGNVH